MLASPWLLALLLGIQGPGPAPLESASTPAADAKTADPAELCARVYITADNTEPAFRDAVEAQVADLDAPLAFGGGGECKREVSFGLRKDTSHAYFEIFVEDTHRPTQRIVRILGPVDMSSSVRDETFALIVRRCLEAALAGENIQVEQARIEARELTEGAFDPPVPETRGLEAKCEVCSEPVVTEDPSPRLRRNWLRLDTDYMGHSWAKEVPWLNSILLSVAWEHISGAEVQVGGAITRALELDDIVYFRVSPISVRVLPGYRYSWDRSSVAVQAGFLASAYDFSSLPLEAGVIGEPEEARRWDFGALLGVDGDFRLAGPVRLHGGMAAQLFPAAFPFTVKESGTDRNLLTQQPLRFELRLGLRVRI